MHPILEVSSAFLATYTVIPNHRGLDLVSRETTLIGSISLTIIMTHVIQSLSMLLDTTR